MENETTIPLKLRRRILQVGEELDYVFEAVPDYGSSTHKESFINSTSQTISAYVVFNLHPEMSGDERHKQIDEYLPFIKCFFRDKLSLHWEKQNEE
jgi:hypothetical protein